jgi:hypothetical protein
VVVVVGVVLGFPPGPVAGVGGVVLGLVVVVVEAGGVMLGFGGVVVVVVV